MKVETVHQGWVQLRAGDKLIADIWEVKRSKLESRRGWAWALAPYSVDEIHWGLPTRKEAIAAAEALLAAAEAA